MPGPKYEVPSDLLFTKEHEWARRQGGVVRVGITDYAAKTLNDVVYVTAPKVGAVVTQFGAMGSVESIKAVSELYSPLSGTVTKINTQLDSHPELVNKSPYVEGWLLELKPSDFDGERERLLDPKEYERHLDVVSKK